MSPDQAPRRHTWVGGRCTSCGASLSSYGLSDACSGPPPSQLAGVPSLNVAVTLAGAEKATEALRGAARALLVGAPVEAGQVAALADQAQALATAMEAELARRERGGTL